MIKYFSEIKNWRLRKKIKSFILLKLKDNATSLKKLKLIEVDYYYLSKNVVNVKSLALKSQVYYYLDAYIFIENNKINVQKSDNFEIYRLDNNQAKNWENYKNLGY